MFKLSLLKRYVSGRRTYMTQFPARPKTSQVTATTSPIDELQALIRDNHTVQALDLYKKLDQQPPQTITQRLAVLLAKSERHQTKTAWKLLRSLYTRPSFSPDHYSPIAFIYVIDGAIRHGLKKEALETYDEANNLGVVLDLPSYNALVNQMIECNELDQAVDLLKDLLSGNHVVPAEETFMPVVRALIAQQDFNSATEVLQLIRQKRKKLSLDIYSEISELQAKYDDKSKPLGLDHEAFLNFLDAATDEDLEAELIKIETGDMDLSELDLTFDLDGNDDDDDDDTPK